METQWSIGICLSLGMLLNLGCTPQAAADQPERVLQFPADRAVGTIYTRPADEHRHDLWNTMDWVKLGDARGDVRVDATADAQLTVSNSASSDLSFLDQLQPDDLHTLELSRSHVNDDQLAHVGRLSGLRVLELAQTRITDAGIAHLAGLKKLQRIGLEAFHVNLDGFGVGDGGMAVLATLPELRCVDLRLTKISDDGLKQLASLRSLESLGIAGTRTTDAGMDSLKQLSRLEYLRLGVYDEGNQLTDDGLPDIGEITSLKLLDLSGTEITDAGLVHLQKLINLENLTLDDTNVTPAGLANLEPLQSLRGLRCYLRSEFDDEAAIAVSRLKSLRRITVDLHISEKGVAALATLPHLESLDLRDDGVTDAALAHIGQIESLKQLDLYDCPITDDGLVHLTTLRELESLGLHGTIVSPSGLRHLRKLPCLTRLTLGLGDDDDSTATIIASLDQVGQLSNLTNLTLRGDGFANPDLAPLENLSKLQCLTIDGVPIDDRGASHLSGLVSLQELSLDGAVITDEGLAPLANLHQLSWLTLDGHFTDKGVQQLGKLRSLQHVYLASPHLTDEGISRLSASSPSLMTVRRIKTGSGLPRISYREFDTFRREGLEAERVEKNALELKAPPPWTLTGWINTDGKELTLGDLSGKVVVVDFWGTWCGPCRAAMPELKRLQEQYPKDLVVLGIHTTSGAEDMPDYVREEGFDWPMASDVDETTVRAWFVDSYPDLYLIDRQGRLRVADLYRDDLVRAVRELVIENDSGGSAVESECKTNNSVVDEVTK